ncbi:MAG TPA: DNA repair protein RecO [Thermoleophilia bacterium]|nr:DNA repair protein RecO [Thermoleophilia bacterium]
MRYATTRAVVLSSRPLAEADRWLTLFTRDQGRIDAVVKGVRRTTSRWGGRLEPFNVCDVVLYRGRSRATVTSAQLVDVFRHLREDREALTAAAVACEAAALLFAEGEPEVRAFTLLRSALRAIDAGFAGPALRAPLVLGSLMKLMYEAGYLPVLDRCASCGGGGRALAFSAARGGLVCGECLGDGVPVTPEAIAALRDAVTRPLSELRAAPPSEAVEEALRDLHLLFAYHTGTRLRALRFARL